MKRCFSRYRLALFALSMVSSTMFADQIWRGTSGGDVIDENLVIKEDVLLRLGATKIAAIHKDVTVTVTRDVSISGHWAGESQLYLVAAEGRTIRFVGDHNITFVGSSQITGDDLLVVQSGPGVVEVAIGEGKRFSLTSQDGSGGVQYYVLMYGGADAPIDEYCCDEYSSCCDEYSSGGILCDEYCVEEYCAGGGVNETSEFRPVLSFVSLDTVARAHNKDREVRVGRKSKLGFLSSRKTDIAQDSGYITFDPSIDGLGRMILDIENRGAFVTSGIYTCQRNGCNITLASIYPAVSAGFEAIWTIMNSLGSETAAGLLVLDKNETLGELLIDPFLDLGARDDIVNSRGSFTGKRYGVVLGSNGVLWIQSNSYLDFVSLALNQMPDVTIRAHEKINLNRILKMRNPSAFIVDGNNNPSAIDARILFGAQAAFYLRSGVADDGVIRDQSDVDPFTIDAANRTRGVGNIVFDLEGALTVNGVPANRASVDVSSKIELLSLEVLPTGGSLFVGSNETNFPLRTFNTEDGELLQYNSGAFLINNTMTLYDTALSHTDESHLVYPNNDLRSEPAYIGGERFKLLESDVRPSINFVNSYFLLNSSVALTGMDLVVPNFVDEQGVARDNVSNFMFYANGVCIDNGTGRQMILGTRIGSTAADGCTRIDGDAHLDVMETTNAIASDFNPLNPNGNHTLLLTTDSNSSDVVNNSIHTIYLGGTSNISIGVNADTTGFNIDTNPWLRIQGNVFSFETRPAAVSRSTVTGTNAIFVDLNGKISIDPGYIANFGVMVIKSRNGIVDLPAGQVFFSNGAGIATWNIDLSLPADRIIVPADQSLSTYVFNWIRAGKDCPSFNPFNCCVGACPCAAVTEDNIASLPIIQGSIEDLQLQGTRIGDPAQFVIDGGLVRQITFAPSLCSAEAPVATIVLQNGGTVGLDSTTNLGVNGVTIIANGSGVVNVNGDLVINNTCALVKGPNFAAGDVLQLTSDVQRQILLKTNGVLDLSSFNTVDDIVSFGGSINFVVEPGATIVTGLGTLRFTDNAQLNFLAANAAAFFNAIAHGAHDEELNPLAIVPAADIHNPLASLTNFGQELNNTDSFRVKLVGQGTIELSGSAQASVPFNAFVGVETLNNPACEVTTTDLTLAILENASFMVGRLNINRGGVLQIGNVDDQAGHTVNFTLTLDGPNALFSIGSEGFVGLGVGIERFDGTIEEPVRVATRAPGDLIVVPNENIVNTLNNVGATTFNFLNGRFAHDRIFRGDDVNASLLAVTGVEGATFNLNFELENENIDPTLGRESNFVVAGGGNMVLIQPGTGGLHPIVLDQNGEITPRLTVGIMASTLLQPDNVDVTGLSGAAFFDYFATQDATVATSRDNTFGRANAAAQGDSERLGENIRVGAISNDVIIRAKAFDIIGSGEEQQRNQNAIDAGAVFATIDPVTNQIITIANIQA